MSAFVINNDDADDGANESINSVAKMCKALTVERHAVPKFPTMRTYSCESSLSDRLVLQKFELDRVTRQFNTVRHQINATSLHQPGLKGEMTVALRPPPSSGSSEKIRAMKHEIMELRAKVEFQQQRISHQCEVIRDLEQQQDTELPLHLAKIQELLVAYKNYATILEAERFDKSPLEIDPQFNAKGQTLGNGFIRQTNITPNIA